jgi:hypothetical protein
MNLNHPKPLQRRGLQRQIEDMFSMGAGYPPLEGLGVVAPIEMLKSKEKNKSIRSRLHID